jgi:WXG100 family type VII secretion target
MPEQFAVDPAMMARGQQAVADACGQIDGHVKRLDSEIQNMFASWRGEAQQQYAQLHSAWSEQQQKLLMALRDMQEALKGTTDVYLQNEAEQADSIRGLAGQI